MVHWQHIALRLCHIVFVLFFVQHTDSASQWRHILVSLIVIHVCNMEHAWPNSPVTYYHYIILLLLLLFSYKKLCNKFDSLVKILEAYLSQSSDRGYKKYKKKYKKCYPLTYLSKNNFFNIYLLLWNVRAHLYSWPVCRAFCELSRKVFKRLQ